MAAKASPRRQGKITIPDAELPDLEEAMEWDGIDNFAVFALAALRQRIAKLKREKAAALAAEEAAKAAQ